MPRKTKHPNIILALSSAALATAGDVSETIVRQAGTLGPIYSMGAKAAGVRLRAMDKNALG